MKSRVFGTLCAFALAAMLVPLLLACSPNEQQPTLMPPPQETEAEGFAVEGDTWTFTGQY